MFSVAYGLDTPYPYLSFFWNSPHPRHPLIRPISPLSPITHHSQTESRCSADIRQVFVVSLCSIWLVRASRSRSSRETPVIIHTPLIHSLQAMGAVTVRMRKKKILFNSSPIHGQFIRRIDVSF